MFKKIKLYHIIFLAIAIIFSSNLGAIYARVSNPGGAGGGTLDLVELNTSYVETGSEAVGSMYWNPDDLTVNVKINDDVTGQMFEELFVGGINQTGSTITNGTIVMFAGSAGASGKIIIQKMKADGSYLPGYTIGVATQDILNGECGKVTWYGKVRSFDTSGTPYGEIWSDGEELYHSTTTDGQLTNIPPNAPDQRITIGAVIYAHATNGIIIVRPSWRGDLADLDDVNGTIPTDRAILLWQADHDYWDADNYIIDEFDARNSAGRISGGEISTSSTPGTVNIASGSGLIKTKGNQPNADLETVPDAIGDGQAGFTERVEWSTTTDFALAGVGYNLIYWDASAGTFDVQLKGNFYANFDFISDFTVGRVYYDGSEVTIRICGMNIWNFDRRVQMFGEEVFPVVRVPGTMVIGETGTRNITVTSGIMWAELVNRFSVGSFDSSGSDTFLYWYRDGLGDWASTTNQSQIDNTYWDDGTGTLNDLTANRYGVHWVYEVHDESVHVVYGQGDYTLTQAEITRQPGSLPGLIESYATWIGRIIIQKSASSFTELVGPDDIAIGFSTVPQHDDLANLIWSGSGHTGTNNTLAGFDSSGLAIYYSTGTNLSLSGTNINVDDAFLVNNSSDTMIGVLTADGLTLGANENITLGSQTLDHDGTDFNFNDSVDINDGTHGVRIVPGTSTTSLIFY